MINLLACFRPSPAFVLLTAFVFAAPACAQISVPILNSSFETSPLDPDGFTYTLLDWTKNPEVGDATFIERIAGFEAPDGQNYLGQENDGVVYQDLGVTYAPNSVYRLRVAVGNRTGWTLPGNASTYALTEPTSVTTMSSSFDASTLTAGKFADAPDLWVKTALNPDLVGKTIRIRLLAGGAGRSQFDHVRLDFWGPVVTTESDSGPGSLREVIAEARPGDRITFDPEGSVRKIALDTQLTLDKDLAIDGLTMTNEITIEARKENRIFQVESGTTVVLSGLKLAKGYSTVGGGAIHNAGTLTLDRSTLTANSAENGGAILNVGTLLVNRSALTANRIFNFGSGGAIFNTGALIVNQSTLAHNSAVKGGVIFNTGVLTVNQSTLAHNVGSDGGAIFNDGTATVNQSTLANNHAFLTGGGIFNQGTLTLNNSIVAGNKADIDNKNIEGSFTPSGVNLTSVDPKLGALDYYGGPTMTMPLLGGSPALDAGDPLFNGHGLTDQRDYPRVANGQVDIGAVESTLRAYYKASPSELVDAAGGSIVSGVVNGVPGHRHRDNQIDLGFGVDRLLRVVHVSTKHDPDNANRGLGLKGDFTVSVWVHPAELLGVNHWRIVLSNTGAGEAGALHLGLYDNNVHFGFWGNDLRGSKIIKNHDWTHLAWTFNTQGGQMAIWVNGRLDVSSTGRVNTTGDRDILIGFSEALGGESSFDEALFMGQMDELAIFGEALSASQIAALAAPAGIYPNDPLPAPILSPGLTSSTRDWNIREIYAHKDDSELMPYDLASALHVANTPEDGTVINYNSLVINHRDPDTSSVGAPGLFPNDQPFAADNRTPHGLIDGDDDYLTLAARTVIQIATEDDYTFGFSSDDGAQLRIIGAVFHASTRLDPANPADPAHRGDTLLNPGTTPDSRTIGVAHLSSGSYEVEFLSWERAFGAFTEVVAARGAKTALDSDFRLLTPGLFLATAQLMIARESPSKVKISWTGTTPSTRLQSALAVTGPWIDVAGFINGGTEVIEPAPRFFRTAQ